ncbi:uncharacterized protein ACB058_012923 [Synchiropus picturatus]
MERLMLSRKRPLLEVETNMAALHRRTKMSHSQVRTGEVAGESKPMTDSQRLCQQISSWADPKFSLKRVVEHLKFKHASEVIDLDQSINNKYLEFHRDISEECSPEEKQHSWAVLEKPEEVVMHGPYYPDYAEDVHSEEIVVQKTQELLQSELVSDDWKVYIFTVNSPCLTRNTEPCMLNMVEMSQAWWREFGVKTFIGFKRCWGFKGTKENLFQDLSYGQVDCVDHAGDYTSYLELAKKTNLIPICESIYAVVKNFLSPGNVIFTITKEQDLKPHFKRMSSAYELETEMKKEVFKQEMKQFNEAAQLLLTERGGSFEDHLRRGRSFPLQQHFRKASSNTSREQVQRLFQECWRQLVQDKYAELVREKLTEDLNRRTVQLFAEDIAELTKEYLQIGRIQFS